jgi:dTMP kinase
MPVAHPITNIFQGKPTVSLFITFEGPEGSGKTTQIQLLSEMLARQGVPVLTTREPGGTRIGNAIRDLLLNLAYTEMAPRTETLLFNAARAQVVDEVIRPALDRGQTVLCDRYADSTLAYQGYAHGQCQALLQPLIEYATGGLKPDLTVYLDIDPAEGLRRKQGADPDEWNRLDAQTLAFHRKVRTGYLQLVAEEPARWLAIDASQPKETIRQAIWTRVQGYWEGQHQHQESGL